MGCVFAALFVRCSMFNFILRALAALIIGAVFVACMLAYFDVLVQA